MINFEKRIGNATKAALGAVALSFSTPEVSAQSTAYEKDTRPYTNVGPEYDQAVASGSVKSFLDKLNTAAFCPEIHSKGVLFCLRKEGAVEEIVTGLADGGYPAQLLDGLRDDLERYRDHMPNHNSVKPDVKVASDAVLWVMLGRHKDGDRAGIVQVVGRGDAEVALHTPVVSGKTGRVEYPGWKVSTQETMVNGRKALVTVIIMQECGNPTVVVEYLPDSEPRQWMYEGEPCPERTILLENFPGRQRRAITSRVFVFDENKATEILESNIPEGCTAPIIPCDKCDSKSEVRIKKLVSQNTGVPEKRLTAYRFPSEAVQHTGHKNLPLVMPSYVGVRAANGDVRYLDVKDASYMTVCVEVDNDKGEKLCSLVGAVPEDFKNSDNQYVQPWKADDNVDSPTWTFVPCEDVDTFIGNHTGRSRSLIVRGTASRIGGRK